MLSHRDFVPQMTVSPGFIRPAEYESFDEAIGAVNTWLETANVKLVSIETVVLPNIWSPYEEGSEDTSLGMRDTSNHWHQFIRCWYLTTTDSTSTSSSSKASSRVSSEGTSTGAPNVED